MPRKATFAILLIACLFVFMPFLFWRASWFGAPMSASDITASLAPGAKPRDTQHALAQLSTLIDRHDASARQWYPALIAQSHHSDPQIRLTVAWVMGRDNTVPEFHQALLPMLADSDPMVRSNAALSLVRFADASGLPQILSLLQPYTVLAPDDFPGGALRQRLKEHDAVRSGTMVARIDVSVGADQRVRPSVVEVRSPVPGILVHWLQATGARVAPRQPLCVLAPDPQSAWEALRALYLVGQAEDAPIIESFLRSASDAPPNLLEQARLTLDAIRSRKDAPRRSQLLAMLKPYTILAPPRDGLVDGFSFGKLRQRLKEGDAVRPGTLVAHIDWSNVGMPRTLEVRSPVPGILVHWLQPSGSTVWGSQPLCVLSPDPQSAWEALRALYLVGQPEDAPIIESFLRSASDAPPNLLEQARLTLQAIHSREKSP
jgi:biotin carboxyl carrier protein